MRRPAIVLLALLAACAGPRDIAGQSTAANVGVEDAHNKMLLLNVLRAARRRPMYFTAIVSLTLPVPSASPSVSVAIPLESGAAPASGSATLRAEVPSFNVAVLDSQKFITGITTPIRPSLLRFYLEQGWPPMLLLSLAVREIDYAGAQGERRYFNYPPRREEFEAFQAELRAMHACGLRLVEEDVLAGVETPAFRLPQDAGLLSALSGAAREGMVVVPRRDASGRSTGEWQLARPRADVLVVFATPDVPECRALPAQTRERFLRSNAESAGRKAAVMDFPGPAGSQRLIRLMVRSPEAILYYLGELVRAQEAGAGGYTPRIVLARQPDAPAVAIFEVARGEAPGAFVSVEYDGATYSVGAAPDDRSAQSLSLVSLLIGLQKEASEIPITAPIRLIGQ